MWSHARYDLRIPSDEFWELTPKQYHLLNDRHIDDLIHRETVAAITTAAIINSSFNAPADPISPAQFIFNLRKPSKPTSFTLEQVTEREAGLEDFNARSAQLSAELKEFSTTGIAGHVMKQMGIGCPKE